MSLGRKIFSESWRGAFAALALFGNTESGIRADSFPISVIDNRIFVGVEVDGRGPFSFLLDTGSSSVTVEKTLAARLHLKTTGAGSTDGAGERTVSYATVHLDSVALGRFVLGAMNVPSLDNAALARAVGFQKFDGVLGADIFRNRVVSINLNRNLLMVDEAANFHPHRDASALPMELNADEMPVVAGTINGWRGRFLVDTGDRSSLTMFGPFWHEHHLERAIGRTVTAMTGFGVGGPIRGIVGRPSQFSIGDIDVPPPVTRLSLQKAGVFTSSDYAGSIGMGVLKRFVVSFDYAHKTMWLKKSADFAQPDRSDRSGVWLGFGPGANLTVMDVAEDSPAARAGLESGDLVQSVNDIAASRANLFRLRALLRKPELGQANFAVLRHGQEKTVPVQLVDLIDPPK